MKIILLSIILLYQIIISFVDSKDAKKYFNGEKKVDKIRYLKEAVFFGWITTIIVFIFVALTKMTLHDVGFRRITLSNISWLNIITFIICGILLAILLLQMFQCLQAKNKKLLRENYNKEKESKNHYDWVIYNLLIPETKDEKKWFLFVSLTAGICEEIIYRGAIIFLLLNIFPMFDFWIAGIISCILFSLIHSYQGITGIIKTGVIAIMFVLLYYVTGTIIIGMVLHFLLDYSSAFLAGDE